MNPSEIRVWTHVLKKDTQTLFKWLQSLRVPIELKNTRMYNINLIYFLITNFVLILKCRKDLADYTRITPWFVVKFMLPSFHFSIWYFVDCTLLIMYSTCFDFSTWRCQFVFVWWGCTMGLYTNTGCCWITL